MLDDDWVSVYHWRGSSPYEGERNMVRESNLPSAEQIRAERTMRIERRVLSQYDNELVKLHFDAVNVRGDKRAVICKMSTIDDDHIRGLLPSKCWIDDDGELHIVWYSTDGFPVAARAFGSGRTYVAKFIVDDYTTIEYDVQTRVFIDQVLDSRGKCWYVIMFGDNVFDEVVAARRLKPGDVR